MACRYSRQGGRSVRCRRGDDAKPCKGVPRREHGRQRGQRLCEVVVVADSRHPEYRMRLSGNGSAGPGRCRRSEPTATPHSHATTVTLEAMSGSFVPPPGRARGRHPAGLLAAGGLDLGVSHIAPSLRAPSTQRCPIPGLPPAGCVRVGRAWTTRAGSASVWWLIACPVTIAVRVQRRTERTRRCVSHKFTIVSIGNIVGV